MHPFSGSEPPTSIQIEVPVNTSTAPSDLGRFWLIPSNQNQHQDIVLTLAAISGSQLLPGQNVQGSIGFSLRRILSLSIFELMGFSPVSVLELTCRTVLENTTRRAILITHNSLSVRSFMASLQRLLKADYAFVPSVATCPW